MGRKTRNGRRRSLQRSRSVFYRALWPRQAAAGPRRSHRRGKHREPPSGGRPPLGFSPSIPPAKQLRVVVAGRGAVRRQGRCEAQRLESSWTRGAETGRRMEWAARRATRTGRQRAARQRNPGGERTSLRPRPRAMSRPSARASGASGGGSAALLEGLRPHTCIAPGTPGSGFSLKGRWSRPGQSLA